MANYYDAYDDGHEAGVKEGYKKGYEAGTAAGGGGETPAPEPAPEPTPTGPVITSVSPASSSDEHSDPDAQIISNNPIVIAGANLDGAKFLVVSSDSAVVLEPVDVGGTTFSEITPGSLGFKGDVDVAAQVRVVAMSDAGITQFNAVFYSYAE